MKKVLVSFFVLVCVTLSAYAQDNSAYEKEMTKMLESTHAMDAMKQVIPQMTAMLKQQVPQAPAEFWKDLETTMTTMYDKIIKAMTPIYQKYLTLEDLKEINKFYATPVGKKLGEMAPKAAMDILPIAQKISMETMQELMQKAQQKGYMKQQ